MTDEKVLRQAKIVYETICSTLESRQWQFSRHDEDLTITCGARGEDLPMDIIIIVNPDAQVVSLFSVLPFSINEKARVEAAIAVSVANYGIVNGSFDYDISDGEIRFRMVSSFRESILGEELFNYMLICSAATVDKYNDKFLMLSNGMWNIEQFIKWDRGISDT